MLSDDNFIFALAAFKAEMNIFSVKIPPVFIFFGQDNVFMVLAFIDAEIALDQVIIDNNGNMKFTADNFSRLQGTLQRAGIDYPHAQRTQGFGQQMSLSHAGQVEFGIVSGPLPASLTVKIRFAVTENIKNFMSHALTFCRGLSQTCFSISPSR